MNDTKISSGKRDDLHRALAAWEDIQGLWEGIPACHKQLLEYFGVSAQAAVWVAAVMPRRGIELPTPINEVLQWNPHIIAATAQSAKMGQGLLPTRTSQAVAALQARGVPTEYLTSGSLLLEELQEMQAIAQELQPSLQRWSDQPLLDLLLPIMLYGVAHASTGADDLLSEQ